MKKTIFNFQLSIFNLILFILCLACILPSCTEQPVSKRLFDHVVVIGIDGLCVEGLKQAATPVMDNLIANGAVTYQARVVQPSSSAANWGAMLHGAGTEVSGITSNRWRPDGQFMPPVIRNQAGRFPNIFNIIREQLPEAEQGAIVNWDGIRHLLQEEVVDRYETYASDGETTLHVCDYIRTKKPNFLFIQLDEVDGAGIWMSPKYLDVVAYNDSLVGRIMESIHEAGMDDNTLVMVVSDHGGINGGHGGETPEEVIVPVIFHGNGIKKGYTVRQPVYVYDLAANVALALNLKAPYAWTGRPTFPAFEGYDEPE